MKPFRRLMNRIGVTDIQTMVDVGANKGQSLDVVTESGFTPAVVAIEMLPDMCHQLHSHWRHVLPLEIINKAVGDYVGTVRPLRCSNIQTSSLLACTDESRQLYHHPFQQWYDPPVEIDTLDNILCTIDSNALRRPHTIDLLKIDVQGYELPVLAGASQTLARSRMVIIECNMIDCYMSGSTFLPVNTALERHGFRLKYLFQPYLDDETTIVNHCDGLYLREQPL